MTSWHAESVGGEFLKGLSIWNRAGEEAQPEVAEPAPSAQAAPAALQPDPAIVEALVQMGFTENGSKRAAVATQVAVPTH